MIMCLGSSNLVEYRLYLARSSLAVVFVDRMLWSYVAGYVPGEGRRIASLDNSSEVRAWSSHD